MTTEQKLAIRLSEIRSRLNELSGIEKVTPELRTETDSLSTEYADTERRWRAAKIADAGKVKDDPDGNGKAKGEGAERRELVERSSLGEIVGAAVDHSQPEGATAELQKELGINGNQVPLALLEARGAVEQRTSGVTPAPATGSIGANQQPIIDFVFPQGAVAFLNIPEPTVGVGEAVYTVLSTAASPGTPAKGADQGHSTAAFSAKVLKPSRIQASVFYSREDAARLAGLDAALRMNLSDALSNQLDQEVLTGTNGLLTGTNLDNNDASSADTFNSYRSRFCYGNIDGSFAAVSSDLKLVLGSDTYSAMATQFRGTSSDVDSLASLMLISGGVRVSANVTATASKKQNGVVRRGMRMDAVAPVWEGVTLILDEVTQAKAGEVVITAIMLFSFDILRKNGFVKVQAQHA